MSKKSANVYSTLGASNHAREERAELDLYYTHPKAVEELLKLEKFASQIWEPCDGLGHISGALAGNGYAVRRSDIVTRGRKIEQLDFLSYDGEAWGGDIITNPPYSCATILCVRLSRLCRMVARWQCGCAYFSLRASIGKCCFKSTRQRQSMCHPRGLSAGKTASSATAHRRDMRGMCGRRATKVKLQ